MLGTRILIQIMSSYVCFNSLGPDLWQRTSVARGRSSLACWGLCQFDWREKKT